MNRIHEVIVEHCWDVFLGIHELIETRSRKGWLYLGKVSLAEDYKKTGLSTSSIADYNLTFLVLPWKER